MSQRLTPIKRRIFIRKLRVFGFEGPFPGAKHAYMQRVRHKIRIPNQKEIGPRLLGELLRQANISYEEWFDA